MSTPILQDHPPLPLYIDSTMLTTFRSCPRKHFWSFLQNLQPLGQSIHLLAGGAFAAGCEAARKAQAASLAPLSVDELTEVIFPPFLKAWGDYQASEEDAKNFHNTFAALVEYITIRYHPFYDEVKPLKTTDGKLVACEHSFTIPLPILHPSGEPFMFVGRFDLLGKWQDSITVLLDEKTTSMMGPSWSRQWDLRGQFIGYVWAAQQLGYDVSTMIVRGVAIQKTQYQFQQLPVRIPPILVDRWLCELECTLKAMIKAYEENYWSYNFGDACSSYGGCQFMDLCKAPHPENWLNNYEHRTWSPVVKEEA